MSTSASWKRSCLKRLGSFRFSGLLWIVITLHEHAAGLRASHIILMHQRACDAAWLPSWAASAGQGLIYTHTAVYSTPLALTHSQGCCITSSH